MILAASCGWQSTAKQSGEQQSDTGRGSNFEKNSQNTDGKQNPETERLWAMLAGFWEYIHTDNEGKTIYDYDVFNYFGYDGNQKPFFSMVWGFEGGEPEYATQVTAIGENRFRITAYIPAIEGESLWGDPHEAYTKTYEIDMSRFAEKRIALSIDGQVSEWEFAGKEMPILVAEADYVNAIKGNIVKVSRYEDRTGSNLIILTETDVESRPDPGDRENTLRSKELYARRYVCGEDREDMKMAWQVTDFVRDCWLYEIAVSFVGDAFRITDLNDDGLSEVWMTYTLACRGEPSPMTMKIIMYEGDHKYAIRGLSRSLVADFGDPEKNEYAGGDYVADAAFDSAPPAFLDFANELWKKYK